MFIRRKTMERLLHDQQRAHQADRRELLQLIREQNDRLMYLAGKAWAPAPADIPEAAPGDEPDEPSLDPGDLEDDLGSYPI